LKLSPNKFKVEVVKSSWQRKSEKMDWSMEVGLEMVKSNGNVIITLVRSSENWIERPTFSQSEHDRESGIWSIEVIEESLQIQI
jgi:hypothetical protein